MKTYTKVFVCLLMLAGFAIQSRAASLISEGTLQAVLDPTGQTPGFVLSNGIPNTGAMGGIWAVVPTNTLRLSATAVYGPSVIQEPGGRISLLFDGSATNAFTTWTANQQSGGTNLPAPASLVTPNPTFSVEVWAMAPTLSALSTMVSWGNTSTAANQLLFNYGTSDGNVGGALNQGSTVLNWGAGGPPAAGVYHHLVATFDGTTTKLYCDGVLVQSSASIATFTPSTGFPINVGSTRSGSGTAGENGTINTSLGNSAAGHARMHIGKVRIMDGVLTQSDITNNYLVDLPNFSLTPSTLAHRPIHAWVFNNSAGDAQQAPFVTDVGTIGGSTATVYSVFSPGFPGGLASFKTTSLPQGRYLHLDGGTPTNGGYVDLGTNLISSLSGFATNNGRPVGSVGYASTPGSTGQVTVEGWLTVKGHPNYWQTYFAFGDTTATNVYTVSTNNVTNFVTTNVISGRIIGLAMYGQSGPGGLSTSAQNDGQLAGNTSGYQGVNMWLFQQNNTDTGATKTDLNGNSDTFYGGFSNATPLEDDVYIEYAENQKHPFSFTHYASSWNESNNEIVTYINGEEMGRNITDKKMFMIYDRNCWLGRDFYFGNPTLEGDYYEFRIYSNILSPAEVLGDYEVGPGLTNNVALGSATALHIVRTTSSSNWVGSVAYFSVTADYSSASGVNVLANGVTYSNSNPSVVSVTAGALHFLAPGSATIQATYGGQTATLALNVVPLGAWMTHRLSFGSDSIGEPFDSITQTYPSGSYGYNGATPTGAGVLITNGVVSGTPGWIDMGPNWVAPAYDALTVELWASFAAPSGTSPLFSFGDQRVNSAGILDLLAGNGLPGTALPMGGRYAIEAYSSPTTQLSWSADDPDTGNNYGVSVSSALNGGINGTNMQHVVAEYNPTGGFSRVYVNGNPTVATNQYLPLLNALVDNYNYIGLGVNSGYLPTAPGAGEAPAGGNPGGGTQSTNNMFLYEFRVYNGVLAQSNVEMDFATGPAVILTNAGVLQSLSLFTSNSVLVSQSAPSVLLGNFANVSNINMFLFDTNTTISSSAPGILSVSPNGVVTGVSPGTAEVIVNYPGFSPLSNAVQVVSLIPVLVHEWSFNTNSGPGGSNWDSIVGAFNATNMGNAHVANGQLILTTNGVNASTDYETLPANAINPSEVVLSFEAWASFTNHTGALANYADLWSFGTTNTEGNAAYYLSMSPHSGNDGPFSFTTFTFNPPAPDTMLAINPTDPGALTGPQQGFWIGGGFTQAASLGEIDAFGTLTGNISTADPLDGKANVHIVGVYHPFGGYMQLYTNGVLAGTNVLSSTSPTALQLVQDTQSFLGRGTTSNTDFLDGSIDEFRIYTGLVTPQQVALDYSVGPNAVVSLAAPNLPPAPNFFFGTLAVGNMFITSISTPGMQNSMLVDGVQSVVITGAGSNSINQTFSGLSLQGGFITNSTAGGIDSAPTIASSNPGVVQIIGNNLIARQPGTTTITVTYIAANPAPGDFAFNDNATITSSTTITVGYSPGAVQLVHRYSFNEPTNATIAHDSVGHIDATLHYTARFDGIGHMLLDGSISNNPSGPDDFSYAVTGPGLIAGLSNATFEGWIQPSNNNNAGRYFETGADSDSTIGGTPNDHGITNCYVNFLDNEATGGPLGASIKPTNSGQTYDTIFVEGNAPVSTNVPTHVVLVIDQSANQGRVYTNGVLASTNTGTMVAYLNQVNDFGTYFGRSHYIGSAQGTGVNGGTVDPPLPGSWDEFRVWNAAMSSNEVMASYLAGPNTLPSPQLVLGTNGGGGLLITYPYYATRTWTLASSPTLSAPVSTWTPVGITPRTNVVNGVDSTISVSVAPGAASQFYILK